MILPNAQQQEIIDSNGRRLAIVAGPGSGKTATLVQRIARLIAEGVSPADIVVITFTRAAANELKERLEKIGIAELAYVGTLHSWMFAIVKRLHATIGLPPQMAVVDDKLAEMILDQVKADLNYAGTKKDLLAALEIAPLDFITNKGKNVLRRGAALVAAAYHQALIENGLLDFNSILAYGLAIMKSGQVVGPVFGQNYLFVDEYQDSGEVDHAIYMAAPFTNKCFIGDPDQSIYAFRGAKPANFIKTAMRPDFQLMRLEINYRSTKHICDATNRLIAYNTKRLSKISIPATDKFGEVSLQHFQTEQGQTNALASILCNLKAGETAAVLCRTNWLAQALGTSLRSVGLPVLTRTTPDVPKDWSLAKMIVTFFIRPENNLLAFRMMVMTRGEDAAKEVQRRAIKTGVSINSLTLKVPALVPVEAMPQALARLNVSSEAVARVVDAIAGLESRTLTELSHAMNMNEQVEEEGQADAPITVCTVHASKGREFDRVYLPSWNQEMFPAKAKDEDLEELRRVAFVAVSRAKSIVWVGTTESHRMHSKAFKPEPTTKSQFITELMKVPCE